MGVGRDADVIVVGAGNAGFCAALSAAERGARVMLLEKAPDEWLGGNSCFTAGGVPTTDGGLEEAAERGERGLGGRGGAGRGGRARPRARAVHRRGLPRRPRARHRGPL